MGQFSTTEKLNNADKLSLQVTGTANDFPAKFWYNEEFGWSPITPPQKIWNDFDLIPGASNFTQADQALANFPLIIEKRKTRLTLDFTSNNRAFLARSVFNDNTTPIFENWIQPSLIRNNGNASFGYAIRLFHGDPDSGGVELSTIYRGGSGGAPSWTFNYSSGLILVSSDESGHYRGLYDTNGLYIVGYRYIGEIGGSGGPSTTKRDIFDILGNGTQTAWEFNHTFGTRNINPQIREDFGEYSYIIIKTTLPTENTIRVEFASPPLTGENYKILIV